MTALFRLTPARLLLAASLSVLALAACTKEKAPEPAVSASASPTEAAAAAPAAAPTSATDPAASNYPKVDPATLTDASTIADVHNALIRPGYDVLTNAESNAPADDAAWKATATAADNVVKGLNLLTKGSRPKDTGDFVKFANAAADKMKVTIDHIAKKDADDLTFSDGDVQEQCTACHSKYRK